MLGRPNPELNRMTVVGGGISGLLLAYEMDRRGYEVTLIERSQRAGGLIETRRNELGLIETAAHSFLASPRVRELCADLSVELIPVRPESRARYVWRGGRMRRFPLRPWELAQLATRALVALAPAKKDPDELTLEDWARRFLGPAANDYLLNPFLRGIYAARPDEISVAGAFPSLSVPKGHSLASLWIARNLTRRVPRPETSRSRGPRPMMAPKDGMGSLVQALIARLQEKLGPRFRLGETFERIPDGAGFDFNLALCLPAYETAKLLSPVDGELSDSLARVQYTPLITATVFVRGTAFRKRPPRGVGVLVPEKETLRQCLGILFNSSAFEGRTLSEEFSSFTVMLGGTSRPDLLGLDDQELKALIEKELQIILGVRGGCEAIEITRWPRAIPVYGKTLRAVHEQAKEGWCSGAGRMLFGNYTGQVSLRGLIESLA